MNWFFNWFVDTSIYIAMPVFVGGFVIVSCAVVLALRPLVHRMVDNPKEWDHALGHVIETFGVIFGILLALVAVSVYENFAEAREASLKEAALVGALYRGTTGLPDEDGAPMRATIQEFVHTVIEEDFPAQRRGELPETSAVLVDEFEELLHEFEPHARAAGGGVLAAARDFRRLHRGPA